MICRCKQVTDEILQPHSVSSSAVCLCTDASTFLEKVLEETHKPIYYRCTGSVEFWHFAYLSFLVSQQHMAFYNNDLVLRAQSHHVQITVEDKRI